jgi:hypothetical protein
MKILKVAAIASAAALAVVTAPASATTFVGSFQVDDGPYWGSNPTVYSAAEAAALLFGGTAADYDISTVSSDAAQINHMGWYTTWGIGGGQMYNEDYKLDLGNPGYNDPGGPGTAISAYTRDNAIGREYTNYVFRVDGLGAVPEPATWAMMLLGFGFVGGTMRSAKRRKSLKVSYT